MKIQIAHLYPDLLNLYGDTGNIASLSYRLKKRGIECEITQYSIGDNIDFENTDIIFIGGGTDKDQIKVCTALLEFKEELKAYVENNGVLLAVCGGFEILGNYIKSADKTVNTLGILDMYTSYDKSRHLGNIVIQSDIIGDRIVGFENHSGLVVADNLTPLGTVITGFGNNGTSGYEGAVYKNVVATYLHGPLLPKNPKLCDYILLKAIEHKYGKYDLPPLDDTIENDAHDYAVQRFGAKK